MVGHSSGGLFTLFAFLTRPGAFQRWVAASPSLFWDDHALAKIAAVMPTDHLNGENTHVFIAVGGLETKQLMGEDMIGDAMDFIAVLEKRRLPGLKLTFHVFPDENHISVIPSALMRGLLQVGALR